MKPTLGNSQFFTARSALLNGMYEHLRRLVTSPARRKVNRVVRTGKVKR